MFLSSLRLSILTNSRMNTSRLLHNSTPKCTSAFHTFNPSKSSPSPIHYVYKNSSRFLSTTGQSIRFKKVTPREQTTATDTDSFAEDFEVLGKGDKVLKVRLSTTRLDGILKIGLQISKNKIEKAFYEDRIRVNGDRPKKKSQQLMEGDEIDIVRGKNKMNEEFLDVSRVEIVKLGEEETGGNSSNDYDSDDDETDYKFPAVLKRYKSLTIENYEGNGKWKGPVSES